MGPALPHGPTDPRQSATPNRDNAEARQDDVPCEHRLRNIIGMFEEHDFSTKQIEDIEAKVASEGWEIDVAMECVGL